MQSTSFTDIKLIDYSQKALASEESASKEELEIMAKIKDIISQFKYNQSSLINEDLKIIKDYQNKRIKIINFYQKDKVRELNHGTCDDLMDKAFIKIKKAFPQLHVTRVHGKTNLFTNHYFLLASFHPLLEEGFVEDSQKIKQIWAKNPYLIDPSEGIVEKIQKTNHYVLCRLARDDHFLLSSNDLIIRDPEESALLSKVAGKSVVGLSMDHDLNLIIHIQTLASKPLAYYPVKLFNEISYTIQDPLAKEMISFLQKKEAEAELAQEEDFKEIYPYYLNDQVLDISQFYFKDENRLVPQLERIVREHKYEDKNHQTQEICTQIQQKYPHYFIYTTQMMSPTRDSRRDAIFLASEPLEIEREWLYIFHRNPLILIPEVNLVVRASVGTQHATTGPLTRFKIA